MSDKFDHIIRDHVDAHEYDINPQDIWDGIHQKTKKKRGFWVWPFGGLGVMLIAVALFTLLGESAEEQVLSMDVSGPNAKRVELPISSEFPRGDEEVIPSVSSSTEQPVIAKSSSRVLLNDKLRESKITNTSLLHKAQGPSVGAISAPFSFVEKSDLQFQSKEIFKKKIQFDVPTIEQMGSMAQLSTQSIDLPYRQRSKHSLENAKYTEIIKPMAQSMLAFSLTSGYSLLDRNLSSPTVDQGVLDLIIGSEQAKFTLNNEFLVHYSLSNNFKISSGLSYQKVVTLFNWNGILLTDSDGDVLSVYDEAVGLSSSFTNLYYESIDRTIKHYNQSYFVDVPVNVDYAFTQWKLRPTISIGAAFNVYNGNSGFRLNREGIPIDFDDLAGSAKIGARYKAAFALDYPISSVFSAYGTVGGSTRKIGQQDLTIRYRWIDFNIGLKYRL